MAKTRVGQLRPGDTVLIPDDSMMMRTVMLATVMENINSRFILLKHEMPSDDYNIIALAHDDNEIYPDTPRVRELADKLAKLEHQRSLVVGELEDIWLNFVGEA